MAQQPTNNRSNQEGETFTSSTFRPQQRTKEIDISTLTEEQFQALRKSDPFMYYSIKQVMEARRSGRTISHADVMASMQGGVDAGAGGAASANHTRVSRKTRISDGCDAVTALGMYLATLDQEMDHEN